MNSSTAIRVIDCHTHFLPWEMLKQDVLETIKKRLRNNVQLDLLSIDPDNAVGILDEANVEKAFVIAYTSPAVMGFTETVNDYVINYCAVHSDRLLPFGSPDIGRPVEEVKLYMQELLERGIKGIKIHPCHQLIYPNEYKTSGNKSLEVVYSKAQEANIPVMFHTGTSIFPRAINRYGDPMCIDDIAVDFPDLKILVAHGGRPIWMSTAFFLVRRHKNVYLDISGIPPDRLLHYFPRIESISEKTLFGSDWPGPDVPSIRANIEAFLKLPLSEVAKQRILRQTALKVIS